MLNSMYYSVCSRNIYMTHSLHLKSDTSPFKILVSILFILSSNQVWEWPHAVLCDGRGCRGAPQYLRHRSFEQRSQPHSGGAQLGTGSGGLLGLYGGPRCTEHPAQAPPQRELLFILRDRECGVPPLLGWVRLQGHQAVLRGGLRVAERGETGGRLHRRPLERRRARVLVADGCSRRVRRNPRVRWVRAARPGEQFEVHYGTHALQQGDHEGRRVHGRGARYEGGVSVC